MLHRSMSKDEVRKLLGEPDRVSVSRFFESWEYSGQKRHLRWEGPRRFSGASGRGRVARRSGVHRPPRSSRRFAGSPRWGVPSMITPGHLGA